MRPPRVAWWKAVLVDVAAGAFAATVIIFCVDSRRRYQAEMAWPVVSATVSSVEQTHGRRNRWFTSLRGRYRADGALRDFAVVWAASDSKDGAPIPPAGTPTAGSVLAIHADPVHPSHVALERPPGGPASVGAMFYVALLVIVALSFGVAIWFI